MSTPLGKPSTPPSRLRGLPAPRLALACLAMAGLLQAAPVLAEEPADRAIAAAVYDLDRIGQQLPGLSPSRTANIRRVERSLGMAEQRLGQSPNKDHPSYQAAQQRINDYRAQLDALKNPAPAPAPAASTPAPAPAAATPGPAAAPAPATAATPRAAPAPAPAAAAAAPAAPQMTSHHKLQLSKLQRSFSSVQTNLDKIDPKSLHFDQERANWRQRFDGLANNLTKFEPFASDPGVAPLIEQLPKMIAQYDAVESESVAAYEALGDIPAQVEALKARYARDKLPKPLDPPYDAERAEAWSGYIKTFAGMAQKDFEWLTMVRETTPRHDKLTQNALNGWVGGTANRAITEAIQETRTRIYEPVRNLEGSSTKFVTNLTPDDKDKIRNNLLGEGDYDKHMDTIRVARQAIENGRIIDTALGQPPAAEGAQILAMLDQWEGKINSLYETVLAEIRMPAAATTDQELMDIAAKVLSGPRHEYEWKRMVVNANKETRQEERAWYSGGVVTIAKYDYDSFQVATAEKVGEDYYIFYNTIRYFRSGGSTTPINRWLLNKRFQSSRILEENIGK